MALSFAVFETGYSEDRQEKARGISQMLEDCTEQKVAAKRPTLFLTTLTTSSSGSQLS